MSEQLGDGAVTRNDEKEMWTLSNADRYETEIKKGCKFNNILS